MSDENLEITGKLKGIENDGIIIRTDGGKKSFSVKKEVIKQLQGKMLKTVTIRISNNIVVKLLDNEIKPSTSGM